MEFVIFHGERLVYSIEDDPNGNAKIMESEVLKKKSFNQKKVNRFELINSMLVKQEKCVRISHFLRIWMSISIQYICLRKTEHTLIRVMDIIDRKENVRAILHWNGPVLGFYAAVIL